MRSTEQSATQVDGSTGASRSSGDGVEEPEGSPSPDDTDGSSEATPGGSGDEHREGERADDPRLVRLTYLLALLPFAVAVVALWLSGHGSYIPTADHAMIEARVIDVLQRPPLLGLFSRGDWSHPGPIMFYALAPFYWVTGGSSIATHLGALTINAGSVVGMAWLARRRGGLPLMLCTVVGIGLLMRTLGAEFIHDPWNTYLPVFPFGLLIFLVWSLACGDRWALPVAVFVASFVAQTHVGFVVVGVPLLLWGTGWLVVTALRGELSQQAESSATGDTDEDEDDSGQATEHWRRRLQPLLRPVLAAVAVGLVLWLLPALDAVRNSPNNAERIVRWFGSEDAAAHNLGDGFKVITGQFSLPVEWLTTKQMMNYGGESPFLDGRPRTPWLLIPVVLAALYLWMRGGASDRATKRHLVGVVGLTLLLGIAAVARTVGPAFDYRLRWTWVPPMVAFAMVTWAAWLSASRRWPAAAGRWIAPLAVATLVVVTGVNSVTATQGGNPYEADTEVVATLGPQVMEALPEGDGVVVVSEPFAHAAWYSRGLVLYLEHRGVDVRVERDLTLHFGAHRVYDGEPIRARLLVMVDHGLDRFVDQPEMELVAEWAWEHADVYEQEAPTREAAQEAFRDTGISEDEYLERVGQLEAPELEPVHYRAAVFLDKNASVP